MNAIDLSGVSKVYDKLTALNNIDLTIKQGEFFGLLGPNGAGKTTLISILAGLVHADTGYTKIMGHDVVKDFVAARHALGVVPQEVAFDPFFTVRETLEIQSGYFGLRNNDAWIDEVLFNLDLTSKANTNMRALSGGMKRRVLIAQAIVHKPPVIILDEPTAGVDVELRQALWKFITRLNREGHTIVLTTHYLEEAQTLCERIALLKQGQIIALDQTQCLLERFASLQLNLRASMHTLTPARLAQLVEHSQASALGPNLINAAELHQQVSTQSAHNTTQLHWRLSGYDQVEGILAICRAHHVDIQEIEIQKADLEDVFVQLIHE
jgi:ABC-2 type transport system ATP-binding protein